MRKKQLTFLLISVLLIFLVSGGLVFSLNNSGKGNAFQHPSDEEITKKVDLLLEDISLGLTKEEVKERFGKDFREGGSNGGEDTIDTMWKYTFFENPNSTSNNIVFDSVDLERFKNRDIGCALTIGFNDKGLVNFAAVTYVIGEDNSVYNYKLTSDGELKRHEIKL